MIGFYGWPCSAITRKEMALLVKWRSRLNTPITKVIQKAIVDWDKEEEKQWEKRKRKSNLDRTSTQTHHKKEEENRQSINSRSKGLLGLANPNDQESYSNNNF